MRLAIACAALVLAACASGRTAERERSAPWARNAAVPAAQAPDVLVHEWTRAANRDECAPLTFGDRSLTEGATPRRANFSGGWAAAWDRPGSPGVDASGAPCAACGRSTFGIAGTGVSHGDDMDREWERQREWTDGAWAGWGLEGGTGPKFLAYIVVPGEECLYNVWSHVSMAHLERLIESLRRVDVPRESRDL